MAKRGDSHCLATVVRVRVFRRDDHVKGQQLSAILQAEKQQKRDEVAIDLEDRQTKKGTPPKPTEEGDIRDLRRGGGNPSAPQRPAPMVE